MQPVIELGVLQPFVDYLRWLKSILGSRNLPASYLPLSLDWFAEFFSTHLPAEDAAIVVAALEASKSELQAANGHAAAYLRGMPEPWDACEAFEEELLAGQHKKAWAIFQQSIEAGQDYVEAALHLVQPALYRIGQKWQENRISVSREHLATVIALSNPDPGLFPCSALSSELAQAQRELLSTNNQLKLKEAERAQSELRLRRNESMLAEAQRLAKVGSWSWDILSDQILWSEEHYRIFGLNPHESGTTYERVMSLVHPDDRQTVRRNVELALQKGQPYECTMRVVHPDGTLRNVQARAQVVRDDDGKTIRMFGTVQDITEQRQLEEALSQEAIRRRILVEQSSDGIVVLDEDGLVFEANLRFGEMLGYTAEEVGQLHVWDWNVQWTREELLRILRSADGSGSHFETRHRRKDGTHLDVEISANGALCNGRKLVFCVCRDISRRKQAEKDIQSLNASLERRVAERTSELVAANAELARAARLKDEFLASMSHELRTPLNGILTMSESLQEQVYGSLNAGQGVRSGISRNVGGTCWP